MDLCSFLGRRDFPLDGLNLGLVGGVRRAFVFVHGLLSNRLDWLLFSFLRLGATRRVPNAIKNAEDLILTFDQGQYRNDD